MTIDPASLDLPEYTISTTLAEVDGPNVRIYCGVKRGGYVHWLYSCVMRADHLLSAVQKSSVAALQAINENVAELMQEAGSARH